MADQLKYKRKIVSNEIIRQQKQRKKTRRRIFNISLFVFINALFISVAFLVLLRVKTITIEGNEKYSSEQIQEILPIDQGDNMYNFFVGDVEKTVKSELPYISTLKITRSLPSTLVLTVTEEPATMFIRIYDDYFLLSKDLLVLEMTDDDTKTIGLPELVSTTVKKCVVGNDIEFRDSTTYGVLKTLEANIEEHIGTENITEIDLTSRFDIWIKYQNRFIVYLGNIEDCDLKMRFLVKIIDEKLYEDQTGRIDISSTEKAYFKEGSLDKMT